METAYFRPVNDFRSPGRAPRCRPEVDDDDVIEGSATLLDENEEWAKIENIMASLDAGLPGVCDVTANGVTSPHNDRVAMTTTPLRQTQSAADGDTSQTLTHFLTSSNLSHLEDVLVANGFDELNFMGPGFICDADLVDIGVTSAEDRRQLLSAFSRLPPSILTTPKQFDCVRSWLRSLRLSEYIDTFHAHGFTTLERLHNLWDVELTSVLRISRLGHRNRILVAIGSLPLVSPVQASSSLVKDKQPGWSSSSSKKQSLNELSLYKDYTSLVHGRSKTSHSLTSDRLSRQRQLPQPPSQPRQPETNQQQERSPRQQEQKQDRRQRQRQLPKAEFLHLRPPQTSDSQVKQWTHQPEVLINSGCTYRAVYIGSGVVSELDNADATRQSIASIRQGSVTSSQEVVDITLSISYSGVKFFRAANNEQLGAHDIDNIFCACQDGSLLDYFAYVAWVASLGHHQCHVFRAESIQMAMEMVLTLGQAFEVAYQLAMLKNSSPESRDPSAHRDKVSSSSATERLWRPPVNAVKPLQTHHVNSSNVTVGLH